MLAPVMLLTVNVIDMVDVGILPNVRAQLPVLAVTQLVDPPGTNEPATTALATTLPLLTSRTVAVTVACQFLPVLLAFPVRFLMATVCCTTRPGAPAASEYTNLFGDPVPTELSLFSEALLVKKFATAAGVASGLACKANEATPAT